MYSCASQSGLSGGERDETPPEIIEEKTFPRNNSTNFNATKIEIVFNEYIQLEKPSQNIVITPTIDDKPTYEVKGKTVVVNLKSKLDENTTYIINFGNSISDITENNKLNSFNYVFSTGDEIDSLTLNGSIYSAFTKKTQKEILVGLYKTNKDSTVIKEQPYYFSITKPDGTFAFKNLKAGTYTIAAIEDLNGNLKYDPFSDGVAFLDSSIIVRYDSLDKPLTLSLFTEQKEKNRVKEKKYKHPGKVTLILENKSVFTNIRLIDNEFIDSLSQAKFENTDSISFWINRVDSISELNFVINIENQEEDTVSLKLRKPKKFNDTILAFKTNTINDLPYFEPVKINFNSPIRIINNNLITLQDEDSTQIDFSVEKENNLVLISSLLKEDINYSITILPNAFEDIYGRTNDTVNLFFKTIPMNQFGSLILHYQKRNNEEQHLIQLIKDEIVIKESIVNSPSETINYKNLLPGSYQLKTIEDKNNNGKWDTGDYLLRRQPELVKLFEDKIDLKGGWDLDLTWEN